MKSENHGGSQEWNIRDALPSDRSFLFATWINSARYRTELGKCLAHKMGNDLFFSEYHDLIESMFRRSKCKLACLPDNTEVILGFAVVEKPGTLHFAFTKKAFTGFGICKSLLKALGLAPCGKNQLYTHQTELARKILLKHPEWVYNPFYLFHSSKEEVYGQRNSLNQVQSPSQGDPSLYGRGSHWIEDLNPLERRRN